jgi:predicted nuclease with TOPRIM domain
MIVVEHPIRPEWQLITPPKAPERTRQVYRFSLTVENGKTARLSVREEKPVRQTVRLMDAGPDLVIHYMEAKEVGPEVKQALGKVVELRHRLDQTRARLRRIDERLNGISQEQSRIRQNMTRLAHNSSLYNRYVRKLDQQETAIENLTREIETVRATEDKQKRELQDYLLELDID